MVGVDSNTARNQSMLIDRRAQGGQIVSLYHAPVWEEPPERAHRRRYEDILADLVTNAGHWARIGEYASPDSAYQAALNLRKRHYRIPSPEDDWDFANCGEYVWARYNGEPNTGE